jgi:hypothetical protein
MSTVMYTNNQATNWDDSLVYGGFGCGNNSNATSLTPANSSTPGAPPAGFIASLADPATTAVPGYQRWGSPYSGAMPFLLCDGSVRAIPYFFDPYGALRPADGLTNLP